MILSKLIYDVRELLNAHSDDSDIDNRYIVYLYGIKRAKYLRQELNNLNRTIDNSIQQEICLDMELVPMSTCSLDLDCEMILRSKMPIPKPIELHTKPAITVVKPSKKITVPFSFVSKSRINYLEGSPYPNTLYAFLDVDNHIYVYSKNESYNLLECITVVGVFEDPLELKNYFDCCKCDNRKACFDELNSNYPLQPHFIDLIKGEIVKDLILKFQIPNDSTNNSSNDQEQQRQQRE